MALVPARGYGVGARTGTLGNKININVRDSTIIAEHGGAKGISADIYSRGNIDIQVQNTRIEDSGISRRWYSCRRPCS